MHVFAIILTLCCYTYVKDTVSQPGERHLDRWAGKQVNGETDRHLDMMACYQTDRQTDRWPGVWTINRSNNSKTKTRRRENNNLARNIQKTDKMKTGKSTKENRSFNPLQEPLINFLQKSVCFLLSSNSKSSLRFHFNRQYLFTSHFFHHRPEGPQHDPRYWGNKLLHELSYG